VALARQLGAEAVAEPRIDLAMLLAREAVNLELDPQTEGTLLATLLRSPAAIGTFTVPIDSRPQAVTVSPDGRTLAVPDNNGHLFFYDPRTHHQLRPPLGDYGGEAPIYSPDGSLLAYNAQNGPGPPFIVVRNGRTLSPVAKLQFDRRWLSHQTADAVYQPFLISPDDRTLYYGYWVIKPTGKPGAAYLDRWSLPSGRPLPTVRIGSGPVTMRLIDDTRQLAVLDAGGMKSLDAQTLRSARLTAMRIPAQSGTEAISPDGRTAAISLLTGGIDFADLTTGSLRRGLGSAAQFANVVYSSDGRVVVATGNDGVVVVWNPASASIVQTLAGHGGAVHGAAFSADGRTLYTSSLDGVLFQWDLGGARRFGRPFTIGPAMPCCAPGIPGTPPLAVSPDGTRFAARVGASTVALFSADTLTQEERFSIKPGGKTITSLAWSPAGHELAIAGSSGLIQLWNVDGIPRPVYSLTGLVSGNKASEAIQAVTFSQTACTLPQATTATPLATGQVTVTSRSGVAPTERLSRRPTDSDSQPTRSHSHRTDDNSPSA
jgi:WD40 repeat protein